MAVEPVSLPCHGAGGGFSFVTLEGGAGGEERREGRVGLGTFRGSLVCVRV